MRGAMAEMDKKKIAVVFPGQGSQRPGMGKDFHDAVPISRDTYHEASDALGWDVPALCFEEDERLNLTEYAQPCILATEIAMLRGLGILYGFEPAYFGGHSLGEYAALVAADALPFSEALKAVQTRGRLMQEATPVGSGAMAAVIADRLDVPAVLGALEDLPVDLANDNSSDQIVISGDAKAMTEAEERIRDFIGSDPFFRFVPLNVSAPFHSRYMAAIEEGFRDVLRGIEGQVQPVNAKRVTSNVTGLFHSDNRAEILDRLVTQLSSTVRGKKNMETLAATADFTVEIGPGRPLRGFFKTMGVECQSVTTLSGARKVFEKGTRSQKPS